MPFRVRLGHCRIQLPDSDVAPARSAGYGMTMPARQSMKVETFPGPTAKAAEYEHVTGLRADTEASVSGGTVAIALGCRRGPAAALAFGPNHQASFLKRIASFQVQGVQVRRGVAG